MVDVERISLRLEAEDLELIDDFVDRHPEFSNRSHLARMAIRAFIEKDGSSAPKTNSNHVTIVMPARIKSIIEHQVEEGWHTTIDEAINKACEMKYLTQAEKDDINTRSYVLQRKVSDNL